MDINVKKLLFSTHGRINRAQWWLGNFIVLISALALASIFHVTIPHELGWQMFTFHNLGIGGVIGIMMFISHVSLNAKRLHDMDRRGWWMLLLYFPLVGYLVGFFILGCIEGGSYVQNKYGPPTKSLTSGDRVRADLGNKDC